MNKIEKKVIVLLLIILICIVIYSSYHILIWYKDNKKTENQITTIQNLVKIEEVKKNNQILRSVDFDELLKINNEIVAWIIIPGTNVNYPVVQHSDNEYYLSHSVDKTKNSAGWVFMDQRNSKEFEDDNTIFYAHGLVNGTMFGSLKEMLKKDHFNKLENRYIYISSQNRNYIYEIFSVYHFIPDKDYIQINISDEEKSKWLSTMKDRNQTNHNVDVKISDKIFTLSTCYNKNERLVVQSKLIYSESKKI